LFNIHYKIYPLYQTKTLTFALFYFIMIYCFNKIKKYLSLGITTLDTAVQYTA